MNGSAQRKPTYEELEALVAKLTQRIEELEKQLAERKPPSKPGRPPGHEGSSRTKPPEADKRINLTLAHCPDCGGPLKKIGTLKK